jgi:hypothetical protein
LGLENLLLYFENLMAACFSKLLQGRDDVLSSNNPSVLESWELSAFTVYLIDVIFFNFGGKDKHKLELGAAKWRCWVS